MNRFQSLSCVLVLSALMPPLFAQQKTIRLYKPNNDFFYYQLNLVGGYDSASEDDVVFASRGPRTQMSFEWFVKDPSHLQLGYTRFAQLESWNVKFSVDVNPDSTGMIGQGQLRFRLQDVWVRFATKWDRTSFWLGHRSIPYGHNPKIDPSLSFMPNQADNDLGFGRDTGFFLKTPVSRNLDLEFSTTLGGVLSGTPFYADLSDEADSVWESNLSYDNSFLTTARIGVPTHYRNEGGVFAIAGKPHQGDEPLETIWRVGGDWIYKHRERWRTVNQLSVGNNSGGTAEARDVAHMLNSVEFFVNRYFRFGVTSMLKREVYENSELGDNKVGEARATLSFALTRNSRFRINPFYEYLNAFDEKDKGVFFQICTGCGLKK